MSKKRQTRDWWREARVGRANDRRIHITEEDKERVRALHKAKTTVREITRQMEGIMSRRSIQFILYPERLARVKARAIEVKRWEAYNTKEIRKPVMQKHRAYIRKLNNMK